MRAKSALLITTVIATAALAQDGAKVGQSMPGPFRALVVTGDLPKPSPEGLLPSERQNLGDYGRVGKYHDFVTQFGLDPCVAVFSHAAPPTADDPLAKLIVSLDQAVTKHRADRLHAWAVFLGLHAEFLKDETRSAQFKQIEAFAQAAKLKNVPLALDQANSERTRTYGIAPETAVTVIVYDNLRVVGRWDFADQKALDEAARDKILAGAVKAAKGKK